MSALRGRLPSMGLSLALSLLWCVVRLAAAQPDPRPAVLRLPARDTSVVLSMLLPVGFDPATYSFWQLQELGGTETSVPVQFIPSTTEDGALGTAQGSWSRSLRREPMPTRNDASNWFPWILPPILNNLAWRISAGSR